MHLTLKVHFDPRQLEIYEGLQLIGPGPAAFWQDACMLMANNCAFQSTAHLIGHLIREIESSLRSVFVPIAITSAKDNKKLNHKQSIKEILAVLGIAENQPEAKAWFELADALHGVAHRRALSTPRSSDEAQIIWENTQNFLLVVLKGFRRRFFDWFAILDDLLYQKSPTKYDAKRLANEVPNNSIIRGYFFDRLENPEWIPPLRKKGFFKTPPLAIRNDERETVLFPPWPEAKYLVRMASHKPELVAEVILDMEETDNCCVHADLADALLAMPADIAARLADRAKTWAEAPYVFFPDNLAQLISHFAKGGKGEEGMAIARSLLNISTESKQTHSPGPNESYRLPTKPKVRFDTWQYGQILDKHYPDIVRKAGLPALQLLCDLLEKAILFSRLRNENKEWKDYSYIWLKAVEHAPENAEHDIKRLLVAGVRDTSEALVRQGKATVEEIVSVIEGMRWKVFHRIALHLLRIFADQAMGLVKAHLTNRRIFDDIALRHEYAILIRKSFRLLPQDAQNCVLAWIEEGPNVECFKKRRQNESGIQASDEEIERFQDIWRRDWLARIGLENLHTGWKAQYRTLVERYGEAEHSDFLVYSEDGWVGPTSPKTAEDLKSMPIVEVVSSLKSWLPPKNVFDEPSPEGLGRELSAVIADNPELFASNAMLFQGLDPTYVRSFLSGLRESLKRQKIFDWSPVVELCRWVLDQPREIKGRQTSDWEYDPDWTWSRKTIADLLFAGFEKSPNTIPLHLQKAVWGVLTLLMEDPDPTPKHEREYGGSNMDPATLSINTIRGQAMHAVIMYALWLKRHREVKEASRKPSKHDFKEMPEVEKMLDAHLDVMREPSPAIRSVYGQFFPWLLLLDERWAKENVGRIFPPSEREKTYFDAAWNTYVAFCQPYDNFLDILREQYSHAVELIGSSREDTNWLADPDERLSEHLMTFYWRGRLDMDNPLLTAFFEKGSDALRAHALTFIGRNLEHIKKPIPEDVSERLVKLWEARLSQAESGHKQEMAAFGWWFISEKFDMKWAVDQLANALKIAEHAQLDHIVVEKLSEVVEAHPVESVDCLRMLIEGDRERWRIYGWDEHAEKLLSNALKDAVAKSEAEKLIHYLGSRGFLKFRTLLD